MDKKEFFITAVNKNQGLIFKIASIYTDTKEDRNDLSQEIIYQLWKSIDSFQQKSSLSTWMYRVAMNVAINHIKISKRKVLTVPLSNQFLEFPEVDDNKMEERWKVFKQHIDKLDLLDKGIVVLYMENKSHDEIAKIIGISTSNVGTKLSRIKEKLRQQIRKTDEL